MQIELAVHQLENVEGQSLADSQETVRQGSPEAELNVVALVARGVHQNVRAAAQRHRGHLRELLNERQT